ncbi:MAG: signal peptidase II [Chloroflexi bacterium]|nr:signal peptidase II [Chloroflexota bacterium]MCL5275817.1 signal peptidase II [Chloroflexota bacterium]
MDSTNGAPVQKASLAEHLLLLVVAIIAMAIDQVTKRLVENTIPLGFTAVPIEALNPYLTLTRTQNTGAAFSILQNGGLFFVIIAVVVSALIVVYAPRLPAGDWISRVALGLQLAGALGNLVDRLRQGYVTDFIHFQIPQINFDWPVSNIADICIVSGVILLIVITFIRERSNTQQNGTEETQPAVR